MGLKLYNTLTKAKEDFVPLDPARVRMYVCGPTVYDFAHIGNARPVIVFDVLYRLLRHLYGPDRVTYVRNITDVDDKINARAARDYPGVPPVEAIRELTESTYAQFQKDVAALGNLPPTVTPRATEHIAEMIGIIERLIAGGFAYAAKGHVLFHVPADADYGKLARRSLDDMIAGARVDVAPYKRDAMDFVLWKPSTPDEPGWESPWGRGRPGWHIECSAMAWKHLGETFDIHGGGIDLVFPHHENEIAQSCSAFHTPIMAKVWMHNGFLQVEGEKMSKSLGNFVTIRELLNDWPGEVLRFTMLKTHYRQPIDWTVRGMTETQTEIREWLRFISDNGLDDPSVRDKLVGDVDEHVVSALLDDLNTPRAITAVRSLLTASKKENIFQPTRIGNFVPTLEFLGVRDVSKVGYFSQTIASYVPARLRDNFNQAFFDLMRLKNLTANGGDGQDEINARLKSLLIDVHFDQRGNPVVKFLAQASPDADNGPAVIQALITARLAARKAKDFAASDRIRDELAAMGVLLKDGKDPATGEPITTWEVKR